MENLLQARLQKGLKQVVNAEELSLTAKKFNSNNSIWEPFNEQNQVLAN